MYNYFVEFVGTIFFVYVILATGNPLAIGAALALAILLASKSSGGHFNPAVSIAMPCATGATSGSTASASGSPRTQPPSGAQAAEM